MIRAMSIVGELCFFLGAKHLAEKEYDSNGYSLFSCGNYCMK